VLLGFFFLIFFGSFLIGVITALLCALCFKHIAFYHSPVVETSIQILWAYMSYLLADSMGLSGIVAILFSGIVMAQYTIPNLSPESKEFTAKIWGAWALITETFVFLYLGLAVFSFAHEYNLAFMLVGLLSIFPARAANVFPISFIVNKTRRVNNIPWNHQVMIWFSGLRGAIAMALSLDVPTPSQPRIFTTTLFIVMVTVFMMGGLTASMLRWLKIDMGPTAGESHGEQEPDIFMNKFDYGVWFKNFESKWIKPIFIRKAMIEHDYGHVAHAGATKTDGNSLELHPYEGEHKPVVMEEMADEEEHLVENGGHGEHDENGGHVALED